MTDLERAKASLAGHTIALCKGEEVITSDLRGISPMLAFIKENKDLSGWSAADVIVGKAAALLFVYAGVKAVYAGVLSSEGARTLESYGVSYEYGTRAQNIVNRAGNDVCPMEKTVLCISDPAEAVRALERKLAELRAANR
ncbi:MAG TPA: DUF1893 domain-containing protein [Candidatus Borkfalkia avistercoris]|uniref:DUF1893 domain-containing protein n=1 Tax=Candidatus Borkfalkia avistercoris TaxID=2838504 RepID=A0A9D2A756_9FIRM|nr:DUF1893 domain-containing protein [Candidatus Borkfalkia avistercoris]